MNRHALTAAVLLTALVGCTAEDGSTPAKVATTQTAPSTTRLGQSVTITRTDTGGKIGTIRFLAVEQIPDRCVPGSDPGQTIAIHVEIQSAAGEELPVPDSYSLRYNDHSGATREVEPTSLYNCDEYPEAVTAPPGGKAEGWIPLEVESDPSEIIYAPYIADQSSTAQDIKWLTLSPAVTKIAVPRLAGPAAEDEPEPEPTTTRAPAPTTTAARPATPVAPPTGRDSQGRPNGSGGELVGCAGEGYQPGTGIYADGSKGFAKECLHQGN